MYMVDNIANTEDDAFDERALATRMPPVPNTNDTSRKLEACHKKM